MAETVDPLVALEAKLIEAATNFQQDYYEMSSDWNRYEHDERNYLKDYIGYALFGPPQPKAPVESKDEAGTKSSDVNENNLQNDEKNEITNNNENIQDAGSYVYEEEQKEAIETIYEKVVRYANYYDSKGSIFCSTIYNVIYNTEQAQKTLEKKREELAVISKQKKDESEGEASECLEPEVQVYPVPVFKVKQIGEQITEKIYYIDNSGRVYDGFTDYLDSNSLPICTMVYPKDGKYQMDQEFFATLDEANIKNDDKLVSLVWLERRQSPADNITAKVLSGGDIATTIVTVVSMGVGIASFLTPIGPAVTLASTVGGVIGGVWGAGRSAQNLADRGLHDESINPLADKSAFTAWMGIAGGAAGLAASGTSALLSRAIRTGTTISRTATVTYDVVLVGNLLVNGVGIGFKGYDIYSSYMDNKEISTVDIVMFAGHIFFFGNSVMNMRFARTIIESSQAQLLKDYESSLRSNRHRKEFQRMARNTRAAGTNDVSSNEEIIRGINKIDNPDEFFQAMVRNRKSLSASNARAAFSDGKVTVNSVLTIDPIEFATLPKEVRTEIIRNVVNPQTVSSSGSNTNNSPGVTNTHAGVSAAKSVSKPTEQAEKSTQQKSNKPAGVKPNKPAEQKQNSAVKPNKVAATQSKDSSRAQQKKSDEIKPNNPSESKSNIPDKPKLKTSSGVPPKNSAESKPNVSAQAPKESAGSKSNTPSGAKPKEMNGGVKQNEMRAGVQAKNRPNETSYKHFDKSNGSVLNEFCVRHASAMFQTTPPQIADFANVLSDLSLVQNYAIIFAKLLELAFQIFQQLPRDEEMELGTILSKIVDFLWAYVKKCIRCASPGIPIDDPMVRKYLDSAIQELWVRVEENIDEWVVAFKKWLEQTFPQSFKIPK